MDVSLAALCRLQDIDSELDRDREELESLPRERRLVEEELTAAAGEHVRAEEARAALAEAQKHCEKEKAEARTRLAEYRTKLLSLKTNAEYRLMLDQIAFVERRMDELDSRTLELMYEDDAAREALQEAARRLDRHRERARRKLDLIEARQAELERTLEALSARRADLLPSINVRLLRKYEQLRSSGKSAAVVDLVRGACGGCLTRIPPQNAVEIGQGAGYTCPICGRFVIASRAPVGDSVE